MKPNPYHTLIYICKIKTESVALYGANSPRYLFIFTINKQHLDSGDLRGENKESKYGKEILH